MTKKELGQLYYLNREIVSDTEELVNLKIECRRLKNGEWDKRHQKMIKRREEELVEKIRRCTELRDRARKFIDSIEDSLTRQVFHYRYSRSMTWQQVASTLGGRNTNEGVRKMVERYLKKVENEK